jgi:hypothetical protein
MPGLFCLCSLPTPQEVENEGNHRQDDEDVDEEPSHVKYEEAENPGNQEHQSKN